MNQSVSVRQIMASSSRASGLLAFAALMGSVLLPVAAGAADAPADRIASVRNYCSGCHLEEGSGHFHRLSDIRKTPEGWLMTIFRMQHVQGLNLPDESRDLIIQYLSDTQGLAPSESAAGRFALERRPNAQDLQLGEDLPAMCGRCHSLARVALQRRDADEWLKHMNMHVGQFPSLEYQASGRDRYWWQIATTVLPAKLGAMFPLDSADWRAWKDRPHANLEGQWLVRGHTPGHGDGFGTLSVKSTGPDTYEAHYALTLADGKPLEMTSSVRVYTGYEWRGTIESPEGTSREVYAVSEDGRRISGRWFQAQHAEEGGDVIAERADGPAAVFEVSPRALKAGATQEVFVAGRKLSGAPSFGPGVKVKVLHHTPDLLRLSVSVDAKAAIGARAVSVGKTKAPNLAVVYDRVDRLQVSPAYAIARVGGGKTPAVPAQFEAFGFLDPRAGSAVKTPLALGPLPVEWAVTPRNEEAVKAEDVKFAGTMEAGGRFMPAGAGPNPQRKFASNNAGDLTVVANLKQDGQPVKCDAHLIVTVQRWNTPPIY